MKVVNFTRLNAHTKPNLDNQISPDSYADYFGFGSADVQKITRRYGMQQQEISPFFQQKMIGCPEESI